MQEQKDSEEKEVPQTISVSLSLSKWPSRWLVPSPVAINAGECVR